MEPQGPPTWLRALVWLRRFRHRCGYGVHSPFAFRLITDVIYDRRKFYAYGPLAIQRRAHVCGLSERLDQLMLRLAREVQPRRVALWGDPVDMTRRYVEAGCQPDCIETVGCGRLPENRNYDWVFARRPGDSFDLFDQAARQAPNHALFIFEGIHRSKTAASNWKRITNDPRSTVTFDLYDIGLIFIHPKLNPQNYIVNF